MTTVWTFRDKDAEPEAVSFDALPAVNEILKGQLSSDDQEEANKTRPIGP